MKTYADRMQQVEFSPVRKVLERAREIEQNGSRVIHFEIGEPDFDTPAVIVEAAKRALDNNHTHYGPNRGILPLREAIAAKLKETVGISYQPETEVLLTAGAAEAIMDAILGLVDEGSEIIGFTPAFMNYKNIAHMAGAVFVELPLREENGFEIDINELKQAINKKTRMLVINNPQNPCGTLQSPDTLQRIAELAVEHDLLILSDEIYDGIIYDNAAFYSIASFPGMRERTLVINGFSKSFAMTGWRVGYLAADEALIPAILKMHQYNTCCIPTFIQVALAETMNGEACSAAVKSMAARFSERRAVLLKELQTVPALSFILPKGAFYIFVNVERTGLDGEEFSRRLLEQYGVAVIPGKGFGKDYGNYIRISYAASLEDILEGMRRIRAFIAELN